MVWAGMGRLRRTCRGRITQALDIALVDRIGPRDESPPPNVVTVAPGTTMSEVERMVIEAALKETRGNRRRAADLLGIGERTLYRKIREYRLPEQELSLD